MGRRLYEVWPGNNRFCCKGCITGPASDWAPNMCYYCCVVIVMVPYYVFIAPDIWNRVSPFIPIATTLAVMFSFLTIMLTSCTDPGIIPRKAILMLYDDRNRFEKYVMPGVVDPVTGRDDRRFCPTCEIYKPDRASHCSTCQNCVYVFDHHCPFVNNCIGKRNYRFFLAFLASVVLSIGMIMVSMVMYFLAKASNNVSSTVAVVICSVVVGGLILVLAGFFSYHLYLRCSGKTTRYHHKKLSSQGYNEFNWCQSDPSLCDWNREITDDELNELSKSNADPSSINT